MKTIQRERQGFMIEFDWFDALGTAQEYDAAAQRGTWEGEKLGVFIDRRTQIYYT